MKKSFRLTSLILPLLLAAIFFFPTQAEAAESTDFSDLGIAKIYTRLYSYYDIDDSVLQAQDIESLAAALAKIDPYSRYLTAEQFTALNESYDPSYTGIGVVLEMNADNKVAIKVVFADSVAAAAQFLPGDVIHSVNGVLTAGKSTTEVSQMLQGDVKELLTIEIERNGYIVKYEMARKEMTTPSVFYWMLDNEVAYMQIEKFDLHTGEHIEAAIEYLTSLGMKSLLIDLRDCPGGVMQAAGYTAGVLGEDGPVYFNVGKDGYESFFVNPANEQPLNIPIAVLVNENTASAAEMLTAVLQDTNRAMIVGTPTYGKGVYQSVLQLPSGGALYMTTGKYVTRGYQDIEVLGGITPDVLIKDADQQYQTALSWLKTQQALPDTFTFTIGSNQAKAGNEVFALAHKPYMKAGSSYLPAGEVLQKMGWDFYYYQGDWYAFNGVRRIIIDLSDKEIMSGKYHATVEISNNTVYMPAAFLRNIGYTVDWDGATRTMTISK